MLSAEERRQLIKALKQEKWMCEYTLYNPQKFVAKLLKTMGYGTMVWMLGIRRKWKREK